MSEYALDGLYEKLVENAGDVIVMLDEHGVIAFVNSRVQHYGELTVLETTGRHYAEFIHGDDIERFQAMIELAFLDNPITDFPFKAVSPDGTVSHWTASGGMAQLGGQRVLMAICRDASESVALKEKLLARTNALTTLSEIAVALSSATDLDDGLAKALDQILAALGLRIGAILLKDSEGRLRVGATTAANLAELSAEAEKAGKLISVQCLESGERIVVPDLFDDRVDPVVQELSRSLGIEAFISTPLRCGGNTRASLSLALPKPAHLTLEQNEFLDLAAGILGPAIENATLHSDLADRVDRLAMLERLAKSVNAARDVHTVLELCMSEIALLVPYDIGVVVLFGSDAEVDVYPFSEDGTMHATTGIDLDHEQIRRLAQVSAPVALSDIGEVSRFHTRADTFSQSTGCAGIVPLSSRGEKFGLLKVWSKEQGRYGKREMEILEAAAEHLSIAAYNARLYEAEQQKSLELVALASESRHRIKNNLQMISGLLEISCCDAETGARTLQRCLRQVQAISTVHDLLRPTNMGAKIQITECVSKIAENALQATGRADSIELTITGDDCAMASDSATAVGVIVNELISNAVEHGFERIDRGHIDIRMTREQKSYCIEVIDDGAGLPDGFIVPEPSASSTGLGLVSSLAAYGLGGKLEMGRELSGTVARIRLKGV